MKNIKKVSKRLSVIFTTTALLFSGCSLDEKVYSIYTPENFYSNETQILSALSGIYRNFAGIGGMGVEYRSLELCTDQVVVQGKIQGWWDDNNYHAFAEHSWDASHPYLNGTWNTFFRTVGQTNSLINTLESAPMDVAGPIAELRSLRAYAYFYLMDLFGRVPVFTLPKVDPLNLPEQSSRAEVFDFVTSEIEAALHDLPTKAASGSEYYGRLTREAAYALLATIYLNAEVYTGTPQYEKAIHYADLVIDSNAYSLLPNYFDNFTADNQNNAEFIFGGVYSPDFSGGIGHSFVQKVLPGIQGGLFGLPYTPQNGFATRPSIVDKYEDIDVRKEIFLTYGPLIDPRTGDQVMVEEVVPDNNSILYDPATSKTGPVPYEIIPATGIRNQPMNAGIKWIKWSIDPNTNGGAAGNDIAFIRFADILLIKAEAVLRLNNDVDTALNLVNKIRSRSNASMLTSLTLEDILDERCRELVFEMSRRRDLIRFGDFGNTWEWKPASEPFRQLYPIPNEALNANPKLTQNPGYN